MRLVDTSAWVEYLIGSAVGKKLAPELPDRADWLVPSMVQLELAKWLARAVGEDRADGVIAFTATCVVVDLDTQIALLAAAICATHRLATADAIIYATALTYGADLLTCDRHFEGLAGSLAYDAFLVIGQSNAGGNGDIFDPLIDCQPIQGAMQWDAYTQTVLI